MICPDCNGTKIYQGLNSIEPCRECAGTGEFLPHISYVAALKTGSLYIENKVVLCRPPSGRPFRVVDLPVDDPWFQAWCIGKQLNDQNDGGVIKATPGGGFQSQSICVVPRPESFGSLPEPGVHPAARSVVNIVEELKSRRTVTGPAAETLRKLQEEVAVPDIWALPAPHGPSWQTVFDRVNEQVAVNAKVISDASQLNNPAAYGAAAGMADYLSKRNAAAALALKEKEDDEAKSPQQLDDEENEDCEGLEFKIPEPFASEFVAKLQKGDMIRIPLRFVLPSRENNDIERLRKLYGKPV